MNRKTLTAALFLTLTVPALACGGGSSLCVVADPTGTALNVRATPDGKIVAKLTNGTQVDFVEHGEDGDAQWALVAQFAEPWGYVYADYLKCDVEDEYGQLCTVADPTGTALNVRDDANGEIIGSWENGTKVRPYDTVVIDGKTWTAVDRYAEDNALGWVFHDYITCESEDEEYDA